jgi:adenosylcobinamide-GDP ribazoletransferase
LLLVALLSQPFAQVWLVLLLLPMVGRWGIVPLFLTSPSAKTEGLAASLQRRMSLWPMLVSLGLATGVLAVFAPLALLVAASFVWLLRGWVLRRFEGFTGDHLGALIELTEVLVLLGWVVIWRG